MTRYRVICFCFLAVFLRGCQRGDSEDPASNGVGDADGVAYMRRERPTGKFEVFFSTDESCICEIRNAIRRDGGRPDRRSFATALSEMHIILFVSEGRRAVVASYDILGDRYILLNGKRHYCENTLEALNALRKREDTRKLSLEDLEEMEYLLPYLRGRSLHPSTATAAEPAPGVNVR